MWHLPPKLTKLLEDLTANLSGSSDLLLLETFLVFILTQSTSWPELDKKQLWQKSWTVLLFFCLDLLPPSLVLHLLDIWPFAASLISSQNFLLEFDDRFAFSGKSLKHAHSIWHSFRLYNPTLGQVSISGFPAGFGLNSSVWVEVLKSLLHSFS